MLQLFLKGGPIMWPLLLCSLVALTVVLERTLFVLRERGRRSPEVIEAILSHVEGQRLAEALQAGAHSQDFVVRILTESLRHPGRSLSVALLRHSGCELQRFQRGLPILDTIITLAPLLGLLGTVTGMIHAFGLLGASELGAPAAITGGIAEALIATAFGLGIAILALIPFNYLHDRMEEARHEIEDTATHLELLVSRHGVDQAPATDEVTSILQDVEVVA